MSGHRHPEDYPGYEDAYLQWVEGLPPEEREELRRLGLDCPDVPSMQANGYDLDLADCPVASQKAPDFAALIDGPEEEPANPTGNGLHKPKESVFGSGEGGDSPACPKAPNLPAGDRAELDERVWDSVRRIMGEIISMPNRSLTIECVALVSGLSYTGDSMSEIARRHGVTRAAVSKRCVEMSERLGLSPSRAMRSLTARKAYRHAQLRRRTADER